MYIKLFSKIKQVALTHNFFYNKTTGKIKFFNLKYIEYGEKWNKEEGRSFFLAKI